MAAGLLLDRRLSVRTLRDSRIAVDEAACTGAVFTTLLNPDGDGKNYRLGAWTTDGTLAVFALGEAECCIVGAGASSGHGAGGAAGAGDGGLVFNGRLWLSAGVLPIVVGPTTTAPAGTIDLGNNGSYSSFAGVVSRGGRAHGDPNTSTLAIGSAGTDYGVYSGVVSRITGTAVEYGKATYGSYTNGVNPGDGGGADAGAGAGRSSTGHAGVVYVRWEI